MGHAVFVVLHLVAVVFAVWWLLLTIPLHMIYAAITAARNRQDPNAPHWRTHVRCPACRELVRHDATVCRHCGAALDPMVAITKQDRLRADEQGFVLGRRAERDKPE